MAVRYLKKHAALEGVLAGLTGFAGTALMGDGSVLMILNPKELIG